MHLNSQGWGLIFWLGLKRASSIKIIFALFSRGNLTEVCLLGFIQVQAEHICVTHRGPEPSALSKHGQHYSECGLWSAGWWLLRENKMDFETFVEAHSKDAVKMMIHSKKKLFRANQPLHQMTHFGRMWAWSLKKVSCEKWLQQDISRVWNIWPCCAFARCRAVSGAGDGFAWLSQRDRPCNTGLTARKETATGAHHSRASVTSSKVSLRAEGWKGNGKKKSEFRDKKAMVSSGGSVVSLIPVWGLSFITESKFLWVEIQSRRKILVVKHISMHELSNLALVFEH